MQNKKKTKKQTNHRQHSVGNGLNLRDEDMTGNDYLLHLTILSVFVNFDVQQ